MWFSGRVVFAACSYTAFLLVRILTINLRLTYSGVCIFPYKCSLAILLALVNSM